MLKTLICLLMLAGSSQTDSFKKEMKPLESAVDAIVGSTGVQKTQAPKASLIEGYGVIVTMEIALETPAIGPPFGPARNVAEARATVTKRRKELQEKISTFLTERVTKLESVASGESFTIVIHILNANPGDLPDLPVQLVFSVKKQFPPPQVTFREF